MKCSCAPAWFAAAILLCCAARAAPPPEAKTEIDHLLSTVGGSNCRFYRNGSWYDDKSAAAHLTSKLQYLLAKDLVQSAEDFIEKGGSQSSTSGRAYAVQCKGSAPLPSGRWLRILLARYRGSLETPSAAQ